MTTVRVQVKMKNSAYDRRHKFAHIVPEYNEYEGELMKNPKWVGPEYFCLTTGRADFPFRSLLIADLVDGKLLDRRTAPTDRKTYQIASKDKIYLVTNEKGRWSCNCTGFSYRRTCSHVAEAKLSD